MISNTFNGTTIFVSFTELYVLLTEFAAFATRAAYVRMSENYQ